MPSPGGCGHVWSGCEYGHAWPGEVWMCTGSGHPTPVSLCTCVYLKRQVARERCRGVSRLAQWCSLLQMRIRGKKF
eukprot:366127-Chlamydomonas_euryale.AAC.5